MTHYEILEVSDRASGDVIEAAWKVLMRRFHTDGSEPDEEKVRLLNQAHDVLENSEKRHRYDLELAQNRAAAERLRQTSEPSSVHTRFYARSAYPNAYPPDILQQAAMQMGLNIFDIVMRENPGIRVFVNVAAQFRRGGA